MELKAAQNIGIRQTLRTLLFVVSIVESVLLIQETHGDFANGILFYFAEQLNALVLALFSIIFTATFFLGRSAGKAIIVAGKNYLWIGIKYSLLELILVLGYFILVYKANHATPEIWRSLVPAMIKIAIAITGIWLWSTWRIKLKGSSEAMNRS